MKKHKRHGYPSRKEVRIKTWLQHTKMAEILYVEGIISWCIVFYDGSFSEHNSPHSNSRESWQLWRCNWGKDENPYKGWR